MVNTFTPIFKQINSVGSSTFKSFNRSDRKQFNGLINKASTNLMKNKINIGGDKLNFIQRNQNSLLMGGGALVGAASRVAIQRMQNKRKAENEAISKGLKVGTPEYNTYVRNKTNQGLGLAAAKGVGYGLLAGNRIGNQLDYNRGENYAKLIGAKGHVNRSTITNMGRMTRGMGKFVREGAKAIN